MTAQTRRVGRRALWIALVWIFLLTLAPAARAGQETLPQATQEQPAQPNRSPHPIHPLHEIDDAMIRLWNGGIRRFDLRLRVQGASGYQSRVWLDGLFVTRCPLHTEANDSAMWLGRFGCLANGRFAARSGHSVHLCVDEAAGVPVFVEQTRCLSPPKGMGGASQDGRSEPWPYVHSRSVILSRGWCCLDGGYPDVWTLPKK